MDKVVKFSQRIVKRSVKNYYCLQYKYQQIILLLSSKMKISKDQSLGSTRINPKNNLFSDLNNTLNSTKRTLLRDPSLISGVNHFSTNSYMEKVPFTTTKIVYENKQIVEKVPVEKTILEYKAVKKTKSIPKQRIVRDHYVIQSQVSYVPQLVPETRIQYIPVAINSERIQYVPYHRQIVHMGDCCSQQQYTKAQKREDAEVLDSLNLHRARHNSVGGRLKSNRQQLNNGTFNNQKRNINFQRRNSYMQQNQDSIFRTQFKTGRLNGQQQHLQKERRRGVGVTFGKNKMSGSVSRELSESSQRNRSYRIFDLPNRSRSKLLSSFQFESNKI